MNSDSSDRRHNDDERAGGRRSKRDGKVTGKGLATFVTATGIGMLMMIAPRERSSDKIDDDGQDIERRYYDALYEYDTNLLRCSREETQAALRRAIAAEQDLNSLTEAVRAQGDDPEEMMEEWQGAPMVQEEN